MGPFTTPSSTGLKQDFGHATVSGESCHFDAGLGATVSLDHSSTIGPLLGSRYSARDESSFPLKREVDNRNED